MKNILFVIVLGLFAAGCVAPEPPCLVGFELGVLATGSDGNWKGGNSFDHRGKMMSNNRVRTDDTTFGGYGTAFFNTTGGCRAAKGG